MANELRWEDLSPYYLQVIPAENFAHPLKLENPNDRVEFCFILDDIAVR